MRPAENIEKLIRKLRYKTSVETHDRVLGNVMQALDEKQKPGATPPVLWRIIMKNTSIKIAAGIVVIAGILLGLHFAGNPFSATTTFADVVRPILNARTVSLDIVIGSQQNPSVIHDNVMGSRIRRTVSGIQGPDIIIDLEQQKLLTIDHSQKTAVYVGLGGLPDLKNYVEVLKNTINNLESKPDFHIENRGIENFEGTDYLVFIASSENEIVTVWADPETTLPVRIEHKTPNMTIACSNLQFDINFDESLFSMKAPEGYTVQDVGGIDFGNPSESAFIESLRIWAEIIEDGYFPDSINIEDVVKVGPKFDMGMKRKGLTEEQQAEVAVRFGQGLVFIRFFKGQGQWHYAGAGVELGDTKSPIFWYQPKESETWRVIYGDLHVEDTAEQNLPKPELSEKKSKILKSSEQWEKQEFVGLEKDIWHVTAAGEIAASSSITLKKMPQDASSMYVRLPYRNAKLQSVTSGEQVIKFTHIIKDRYEIHLPLDKLSQSELNLTFSWVVSMEELEKKDYGYQLKLQSLIPVTGFKLTSVLEDNCGFKYVDKYVPDPSARSLNSFTRNDTSPIGTEFGSCGLPVEVNK